MKNLILPSLLLGLSPLAQAQQMDSAPTTRVESSGAITFDQLFYDAPGDGQLWVRGRTYKASFGWDGATYIPFLGSDAPRNMPLRLSLRAASLGGQALELNEGASWSRNGDAVTLERGDVDVRYHIGLESIEQTFLLDELPHEGDLVVRVAVETELDQRAMDSGFLFDSDRGGVHYGRATVFDADGRSLAVESRLEEDEISIHVPDSFLREARLPLVVDPIISTHGAYTGHLDSWAGDMAFDVTHDRFMQTFSYNFSGNDCDIYSTTVDRDGNVDFGNAAWVDVTQTHWSDPSIANDNNSNTFLIVCRVMDNNVAQVWSRTRTLPGTGVGPQTKLNQNSNYCGIPKVGGDGNLGETTYFCVAWGEYQGNDIMDIRYRLMHPDGTYASTTVTLDTTTNSIDPAISVSKGTGIGEVSQRCWNLVWTDHPGEMESNIRGAQIAANGWLRTPAFNVDSTSTYHFHPSVSAPLIAGPGGVPDYLVVYSASTDAGSDIHARLFKGDDFQASYDLTALEAETLGEQHHLNDQNSPKVATDGVQFIVAYSERVGQGFQENIYVSSFAHAASNLTLTETRERVSTGEGEHRYPRIASAADAGLVGSQSVGMSWLRIIYEGNNGDFDTMGGVYRTPFGYADVGNPICNGEVNSTGQSSTFRAYGIAHPAFNHLILDVDNLPPFQWGQFLMSQSQTSLPVGNGTLCLGGPQVRLPATTGNSWINGSVTAEIDFTQLPAAATVLVGQSWYFQYWHRDAGSSNFSNALRIDF